MIGQCLPCKLNEIVPEPCRLEVVDQTLSKNVEIGPLLPALIASARVKDIRATQGTSATILAELSTARAMSVLSNPARQTLSMELMQTSECIHSFGFAYVVLTDGTVISLFLGWPKQQERVTSEGIADPKSIKALSLLHLNKQQS